MVYLGKDVGLENIGFFVLKIRWEWLTKLYHIIRLLKLFFKPFFHPKRTICTLQIAYRLMRKVINLPELSCCHIIHHTFWFEALICFYLIARVKHESFPDELSPVNYSFCALWGSVPEWTVKCWKTFMWQWQKWTKWQWVPEILPVSSAFRKVSHYQVI